MSLLPQSAEQTLECRTQTSFKGLHRRDVHRRREHIVGRLSEIDVIIRVHEAVFASPATEQFRGAIRKHLVHVHVRLGAGTGLPDKQRKLCRVRTDGL